MLFILHTKIVILVYVYYWILFSTYKSNDNKLIKPLQKLLDNFQFTDEGETKTYLGVNYTQNKDTYSIDTTQECLIQCILINFHINTMNRYNVFYSNQWFFYAVV